MKASSYGLTVGGVDGHGVLGDFERNHALELGGGASGRVADAHAVQEVCAVVMGAERGSDSQRCASLCCEQIVRAGL